jgi:hypothetical protein
MTQRREGGDGGHQHPQSKQTDGHPRPELGPAPPLAKGRYPGPAEGLPAQRERSVVSLRASVMRSTAER